MCGLLVRDSTFVLFVHGRRRRWVGSETGPGSDQNHNTKVKEAHKKRDRG
jgi:hypothetical protein